MRDQSVGHKKKIVENNIKNAVNIILKQDLGNIKFKDISVTNVTLNKDKSVAKIYWDTYLVEENLVFEKLLSKMGSKVRTMLSQKLKLRYTPRLDFIYDSQFIEEEKITKILDEQKS